jgi:hypothetical protein
MGPGGWENGYSRARHRLVSTTRASGRPAPLSSSGPDGLPSHLDRCTLAATLIDRAKPAFHKRIGRGPPGLIR